MNSPVTRNEKKYLENLFSVYRELIHSTILRRRFISAIPYLCSSMATCGLQPLVSLGWFFFLTTLISGRTCSLRLQKQFAFKYGRIYRFIITMKNQPPVWFNKVPNAIGILYSEIHSSFLFVCIFISLEWEAANKKTSILFYSWRWNEFFLVIFSPADKGRLRHNYTFIPSSSYTSRWQMLNRICSCVIWPALDCA